MAAKISKFLLLLGHIFIAFLQAILRTIWPSTEKSIHGEVALVTGAGHGMGRLFAVKLASLGAKIVVVDINESGNLETAEILRNSGAVVHAYTCDLSKNDEVTNLAKVVKKEVGDVTMILNNAGVVFNKDFMSLTDKMVTTTFDVNILAHFRIIREFLPGMKKKNHGHIIAMASISGKTAAPGFIDYSSTKHAVIGLMDGLRRELRWEGLTGIKVTYSCPSFVTTGFVNNPRSNSHLLVPVLSPDEVVDKTMHGILTDQPCVDIPSSSVASLMRALLPRNVNELIIDYAEPRCNDIFPHMKKED